MDVLTDILDSLRLTGGVVVDAQLTGDFCVHAEFTPQHFAPFFPAPDKLISYHYVRSGQMVVEVEGRTLQLRGTAEEQYQEWRRLLKELYENETGLPVVAAPVAGGQQTAAPANGRGGTR